MALNTVIDKQIEVVEALQKRLDTATENEAGISAALLDSVRTLELLGAVQSVTVDA